MRSRFSNRSAVLVATLVAMGLPYGGFYLLLRASGSIVARASQGRFELEPGGGGVLYALPEGIRPQVYRMYSVPMWLETPLLRFYVAHPAGL